MLYAIIYDLKNEKKDYSSLYEKIKGYGTWMHYIDNLWIIESSLEVTIISKDLRPLIDQKKDYLLIIELVKNYHGLLPKNAWDWLITKIF